MPQKFPSGAESRPARRRRWLLAVQTFWFGANLAVCAIGAAAHSSQPWQINTAYSNGIELATAHHFTPGAVLEFLVLLSVLVCLRGIFLQFRAYSGSGPVEVRTIQTATDRVSDTREYDLAFREYLTLPRIYQVSEVPGDLEPDHLIEIFKAPTYSGWRQALVAGIGYTFPRRAFTITATLRHRTIRPYFGVSVQVRRLPGGTTELETQWSGSFDRALQRAAYAVAAYILPQTRQCRYMPWSAWRGRTLPVSLFRDYQRAKQMVYERRFDYAMYQCRLIKVLAFGYPHIHR